MNDDFDNVPIRDKLLAWSRSAAKWQRLRSTLQKSGVGSSQAEPARLPDAVEKLPVTERCEWALGQLSMERVGLEATRRESAQGAVLRGWALERKAQKLAQDRARARKRLAVLAGAAAVLIIIGAIIGAIWWQFRPPAITKADVEQSLAPELASRGLTATDVSFQVGTPHAGIAEIGVTLNAKLEHPLFVSIPAERYLREQLKFDSQVSRKIAELTSGKDGRRVLDLAALPNRILDPAKIVLVKVATPAGASYNGSSMLLASKRNGTWQVSVRSVYLTGLAGDQKPREGFQGDVFDVGNDADLARLRAILDEQPVVLARLEQARQTLDSQIMAQHRQQEESLIPYFRPSTVFTSAVSRWNSAGKKPVFLEVSEATGGYGNHHLKALFHNDGGWGDGRSFQGDLKYDASRGHFILTLVSRSDQAVSSAGPVLGDVKMINLEMVVDPDRLSGKLDDAVCEWTRVPDGDTERVKRAASPDYFAMLDAIAPDTLYLGTVKLNEANSLKIILRFTRVENAGSLVEAVFQDPDREAWQSRQTGALMGNRYREARWPLRTAEIRNSFPPGIPATSPVMQFRSLAAHMENGTLIADFRGRPFSLERLSPEETARRLRASAAWRQAFDAVIKPGGALAGTVANPDGTLRTPVVLRLLNVDTAKSTVEARLESGQSPGLFRNLNGKLFAEEGTISFAFDMRVGQYNVARTASEPFFRSGGDNLVLSIDGMSLGGRDLQNWGFEFPLAGGLAGRVGN